MTWVAWRQQRLLFGLFAIASALLVAWAVTSGLHEQSLRHMYHAAPCRNGNGNMAKYGAFCRSLYSQFSGSQSHDYLISDFAQFGGLLLGGVLGVSAVAGELERKTARLAWTQSLTRTRWLVTKTLVGLGLILVLVVPMGVVFSWWVGVSRLGARVAPTAYSLAGWMSGVYVVSFFILTIFFGVLIRRSSWTVTAAVVVLIAVFSVMSVEVRPHLVPLNIATTTYHTVTKGDFSTALPRGGAPTNSWILFAGFIPIGSNSIPGSSTDERRWTDRMTRCENTNGSDQGHKINVCLQRAGLREVQIYVSDHEFWQLQIREGALYLIAALLLFGTSVVLIRRIRV